VAGGLILAVAGASLLIHGSSGSAERLGRLAGILILVGLILVAAGAVGKM